MKNKFMMNWLLLSLPITVCGQNKNTHYGLTTGLNISHIVTGGLTSNNLAGYSLGLSAEQHISPRMSVSYELTYSTQGGYYPITGLLGNDKTVTTLNYINLPVILRFRLKRVPISIEAGGQVGDLLTNQNYFSSSKSQSNSNTHTHALDAGLVAGVGYRFASHWFIDVKYFNGFIPVLSDYNAPDPATGVNIFHKVASVYNRVYFIRLYYYL